MKIFETSINIPIGCYNYKATVSKPRIPTRFEEIAVFAVDYFQKLQNRAYHSISLKIIFNNILQISDADDFLSGTVDDLFSASYDILRTKNHSLDKMDLPVSEIEITENGRMLLKDNKMPAVPEQEEGQFFYDYIRKTAIAGKKCGQEDLSLPSLQFAPFANMRIDDVLKTHIKNRSKSKDVIVNVQTEEPQPCFVKEGITLFSDEKGNLSFSGKNNELNDYISRLSSAIAENDILRRIFGKPDQSLENADFETAYLSFEPVNLSGQLKKVPMAVRSSGSTYRKIKPKILEIVIADSNCKAAFVPPDNENGEDTAKLLMPNPFSGEMSGEFDGELYYAKYNMKFYLNSQAVLLPMYVSYKPQKEEAEAFSAAIFENMLAQENEEIYPYLFFVSSMPEHFEKAVSKAIKSGDFYSVIKDSIQILSQWKMENKILQIYSAIVPENLYSDIKKIAEIAGLVKGFRVADKNIFNALLPRIEKNLAQAQPSGIEEAALFVQSKQTLSMQYAENDFAKLGNVLKNHEKFDADSFAAAIDKIAGQEIKLRKFLKVFSKNCLLVPGNLKDLIFFVKRCRANSFILPGIAINSDIAEEILNVSDIDERDKEVLFFIPYAEHIFTLRDIFLKICELFNIKDVRQFAGFKDSSIDFDILRSLLSSWEKSFIACKNVLNMAYGCADIINFVENVRKGLSEIKCHYIFDTCALINHPEILEFAGQKDILIVPKTVLEELDGLKNDNKNGQYARTAIREINSRAGKGITISESFPQILSKDYDRNIKDNLILSVALSYRKKNMALVTDDINLANKAKGENINAVSSEECLKSLHRSGGKI